MRDAALSACRCLELEPRPAPYSVRCLSLRRQHSQVNSHADLSLNPQFGAALGHITNDNRQAKMRVAQLVAHGLGLQNTYLLILNLSGVTTDDDGGIVEDDADGWLRE